MADKTQISPETHIHGKVVGDQPLDVFGSIEGEIHLTSVLTLGQSGRLIGQVHVEEAVIEGHVQGEIIASSRIVLTASARVEAKLSAPIIRMDDGAQVTGEVSMPLDGEVIKPSSVSRPAVSRSAASRPSTPTRVKTTPKPTPVAVEKPVEAKPPVVEKPVEVKAMRVETPAPVQVAVSTPSSGSATMQMSAQRKTSVVVLEEDTPKSEDDTSAPGPPHIEPMPAELPSTEPLENDNEQIDEPASPDDTPESDEEASSPGYSAEEFAKLSAQYDDYTVKELREELRRLDLPISGTKTELVERLIEEG